MEPIIKTQGLKVVYNRGKDNEFTALNGIEIEVYPEEYIIFFGPSGCGKSTLLYSILGLQTPSEGKVYINGRDSLALRDREKSKMDSKFFGIVFQNFNLIYSLNVMDNITLPQVFADVGPKERLEKARALLKRLGLEDRSQSLPSNLSGGQQQRVAICRALINDPTVLLADEPVGNLDSESARVVMETLEDINRKDKKTIILVTHDPSYLKYADRIYYFKDAKLEKVEKNEKKSFEREGAAEPGKGADAAELEKMARVFSHMTVPQLKAWSITNYLTEELTVNQLERLEKAMENLLQGRQSEHDFFEELNRSYGEGGVGLYVSTAERYTLKVGEILKESAALSEAALKNGDNKELILPMIKKYLLKDFEGKLGPSQHERLEKVMSFRIFGGAKKEEFSRILDIPFDKGGVGLNINTAESLAEKLEIILAQNIKG